MMPSLLEGRPLSAWGRVFSATCDTAFWEEKSLERPLGQAGNHLGPGTCTGGMAAAGWGSRGGGISLLVGVEGPMAANCPLLISLFPGPPQEPPPRLGGVVGGCSGAPALLLPSFAHLPFEHRALLCVRVTSFGFASRILATMNPFWGRKWGGKEGAAGCASGALRGFSINR